MHVVIIIGVVRGCPGVESIAAGISCMPVTLHTYILVCIARVITSCGVLIFRICPNPAALVPCMCLEGWTRVSALGGAVAHWAGL